MKRLAPRLGLLPWGLLLVCAVAQAEVPPPPGYSAPALYNRANAYAREGKVGLAVLNYERAKLLDPNDADVEANLRRVRSVAGLPPETRTPFEHAASFATPRVIAWLGILGFVVAGSSMLALKFHRKNRTWLGAATMLGIVAAGAALCNALALRSLVHETVVIARTAPARVSPVPMGEPLFELREGETPEAISRHDSFIMVQTRAGRRGWVSSENLAAVVPQAPL